MTNRPRLFLAAKPTLGLRSVDDLRRDIESGAVREMWDRLVALAEKTVTDGPVLPKADLPGRRAASRDVGNLDAVVCVEAGEQLMRSALVYLVTGREEFKVAAMAQLAVLFDPERWPDWVDQSHLRFGNVDLRTGLLARDVGVAYDWLASALTEEERAWVIEGLDRRAIQPYLAILKTDPWWTHDLHNWLTVIVGGLGVAGMALEGEHPDAQQLIDYGCEKMEEYLSIYGPEGEFNESVGYSSANRFPIYFYLAHLYSTGGKENRLAQKPFTEMCDWIIQTTLPPGRAMGFGDSWPERLIDPEYIGAIAAANQDGVLQGFYQQHQSSTMNSLEFVTYDPTLAPLPPETRLPLFKVYRDQGRLAMCRTDWNPVSTACVVYGKAGREDNHEHNDLGQVCIDGFGERLITDPGSPSTYPKDYGEAPRETYYNASVLGHNVLMFDREEQRRAPHVRGTQLSTVRHHGETIAQQYQPGIGGGWKMDLTNVYAGVTKVTRTVLHLYPGYVAVLDEAELPNERDISLRWHTMDRAEPMAEGRFEVRTEKAKLAGMVVALDQEECTWDRREHAYPENSGDAVGDILEERHESYLEATVRSDRVRFLSLFCVNAVESADVRWTRVGDTWRCGESIAEVTANGVTLRSAVGSISI